MGFWNISPLVSGDLGTRGGNISRNSVDQGILLGQHANVAILQQQQKRRRVWVEDQASSHNFLSVIFGIFGKIWIGICERKKNRRKFFIEIFFDRKTKSKTFGRKKYRLKKNVENIFRSKKKVIEKHFRRLFFSVNFFFSIDFFRSIFFRPIVFSKYFFEKVFGNFEKIFLYFIIIFYLFICRN